MEMSSVLGGVVDDAVASGGFGFVEGFVGAAHHVLDAHVGEIHPDDAEAGGYADGLDVEVAHAFVLALVAEDEVLRPGVDRREETKQ